MNWARKLLRLLWRYRKYLIAAFLIWAGVFFGLGTLVGSKLSEIRLEKFPEINKNDKILIIAPHIDDETIAAAGLIMKSVEVGAKVKIIYITNGDDSLGAVIKEDKRISGNPNDFVNLGELRMKEGKEAMKVLGLGGSDLIFLGYPDRGLTSLLSNYYDSKKPFASNSTKFTYNPYRNTYKLGREYLGINLNEDLKEIILDFKPSLIVSPHQMDKHPDHKASFRFLEKVLAENNLKPKVYTYLVHYGAFPGRKVFRPYEFIYPPKRLLAEEAWYSLDLTPEEQGKKLEAISQNSSQLNGVPFQDFLRSFVKRNEVFEEVE